MDVFLILYINNKNYIIQVLEYMHWFNQISRIKILLIFLAVVISSAFLISSHALVRDLSVQERANMSIWAEAMRSLNHADENTDLSLVLKVINSNSAIPVIVLDSYGTVQTSRNLLLHSTTEHDSIIETKLLADEMKRQGKLIKIDLSRDTLDTRNDYIEICYDDSILLKRLSAYPYVQLAVVCVFFMVVLMALLSSKKAEQNKVWVGLSKETAHQLGTPISSLMAWVQILKENYPNDDLIPEMDQDVKRLQRIAERFSKVGSIPELREENLVQIISNVKEYMSVRISSKIQIIAEMPDEYCPVVMCAPLFEWVIENLCKNAVDAIGRSGEIRLRVIDASNRYYIDVSDTGKGISKKNFKAVFRPGFTTKTRGWGLGLSLAKRIVEDYHKGRIYIRKSELGLGTTFRIELKKH